MQISSEIIFAFGTLVGILITFIGTFLYVRTKIDKFNPILQIAVTALPPYPSENSKTEVAITNIGDKSGDFDGIEVNISCYDDFHIFVEAEDTFVMPGETVNEKVRLPDLPQGNHDIKFIVGTQKGLIFKDDVYYKFECNVTIK
ncbi:MAG: hypothetical protein ACW99G_12630 [Candidatus Thorarchaeota archaeon]